MKLSIVVSIYNMEKYLETSLNSIIDNCEIEDYECILVDGASTDNSKNICLEYQKKYKNFTYIKLNKYNHNNIKNAGLKYSNGEYLYFIKGCDRLCNGFMKEALNYLNQNPDINVYAKNYKIQKKDGTIILFNSYFRSMNIGPILEMCVFRKSAINIVFKEDLCQDIIFSGKIALLNGAYYFNEGYDSFIKNDEYVLSTEPKAGQNIDWIKFTQNKIEEYTSKTIDLSYHVIDKCNKNCIACGHFSPLVSYKDEGVSLKQFEEDLKSVMILKPNINKLILTGGEPTLHKDLIEIIKIAKKYFDYVRLCSNGINVDFFINNAQFLNDNQIEVFVTHYNSENTKKIQQVVEKVGYYYIEELEKRGNREKFYKKHLLSKKTNISKKYNCKRGQCVQLKNKKLHLCQYSANLEFLLNYFKDITFPFSEEGAYIDLVKCRDAEYILNFLYNSWPNICNYCAEPARQASYGSDLVELTTSKKELNEFYE